MVAFLPLFFSAVVLIGLGIWQLTTSLDNLWQRHERFLLARGLSPQRNDIWEQNARRGGWFSLIVGIGLLIVLGILLVSIPAKMSGVSINGRELTQAEWDACGRDTATCLTTEVMRGRR